MSCQIEEQPVQLVVKTTFLEFDSPHAEEISGGGAQRRTKSAPPTMYGQEKEEPLGRSARSISALAVVSDKEPEVACWNMSEREGGKASAVRLEHDESPRKACTRRVSMDWSPTSMGMSSRSTEEGTPSDSEASVDNLANKSQAEEWRTTVMLRNLPNNYTRSMLLQTIDACGYAGTYDFFYMPIDFYSEAALGYAFLNMLTPEYAKALMATFDGFSDWVIPTRKRCMVNWSHPHQGLNSNIERYRNSPVMHKDVPDDFKPLVFQSGVRSKFPQPTRRLKCPRLRTRELPRTPFGCLAQRT